MTDTLTASPATCVGHRRVRPNGDLDLATAPALRAELVDAARSGSTLVVLDLERVPFLDSVGMSVIIGGHKRLPHTGGLLHLAGASTVVRKTLGLARLDVFIPMFDSVGEAEAGCPSVHDAA